MEQEGPWEVCHVQGSEVKGMGSSGEIFEDREEDLEEGEMGPKAHDAGQRHGHSVQETGSSPQATRGRVVEGTLESGICTGEDQNFHWSDPIHLISASSHCGLQPV